ncbi:phosphoadenosine phosphosulfate reductase [Azospirillum thiophilum]|uniref:Adenosine 5'-phosphosulfate reductase n=1 Tax=Azospirillum thiophilum TaxID=528244 RepID=A0AAC8VUC2_9PROT|nr:phosphoadenylyl-sulfate reductase [Azospirillum thiophilum]ALG69604.1 phosphoadenosine phosphosulfate reductase [Azospirillum thiophilum]KJR66720.1 phosphoadenosine phosphosulfate reductase [Azospirillum thiophilum]
MDASTRVKDLTNRYGALEGVPLLSAMHGVFGGRIALLSSFGAESAVLLALAAEATPDFPVLFVNTGKLFGETLRYRDQLVKRLGLTDVREIGPTADDLATADKDGMLFKRDFDACCRLRKTVPLDRALAAAGLDAWVTGRKRFQAATRAALPLFEAEAGRIKVNPLANWDKDRLEEEFIRRDLPRHPLEADGFLSIGCYTCTERVAPGADPRSGRWAGSAKTECGIHTMIGNAR